MSLRKEFIQGYQHGGLQKAGNLPPLKSYQAHKFPWMSFACFNWSLIMLNKYSRIWFEESNQALLYIQRWDNDYVEFSGHHFEVWGEACWWLTQNSGVAQCRHQRILLFVLIGLIWRLERLVPTRSWQFGKLTTPGMDGDVPSLFQCNGKSVRWFLNSTSCNGWQKIFSSCYNIGTNDQGDSGLPIMKWVAVWLTDFKNSINCDEAGSGPSSLHIPQDCSV
jgi:hypothetical protein